MGDGVRTHKDLEGIEVAGAVRCLGGNHPFPKTSFDDLQGMFNGSQRIGCCAAARVKVNDIIVCVGKGFIESLTEEL